MNRRLSAQLAGVFLTSIRFFLACVIALISPRLAHAAPADEYHAEALGPAGLTFSDSKELYSHTGCAAVGDINGDGYRDFVVHRRTGGDELYLVFGRTRFPESLAPDELPRFSTVIRANAARASGVDTGTFAAGDVDQDGFDDFFVASKKVFLIYGSATLPAEIKLDEPDDSFRFVTFVSNEHIQTVSRGGDFDGDGKLDIAFGARFADGDIDEVGEDPDPNVGRAYFFRGLDSYSGSYDLDRIGLDYDGFILKGVIAWAKLGLSTTLLPDVNGDGLSDLLVSTAGFSQQDIAYLILGRQSPLPVSLFANEIVPDGFATRFTGGRFGQKNSFDAVVPAGDLDGDGLQDTWLGQPHHDGDRGAVILLYGQEQFPADLSFTLLQEWGARIRGELFEDLHPLEKGGRAGFSVDVVDWNQDGSRDLIIGAPTFRNEQGVDHVGKAYVIPGRPYARGNHNLVDILQEDSLPPSTLLLAEAVQNLGARVQGLGDINGDGFADLMASGTYTIRLPQPGAPSASQTYVLYGTGPNSGPLTLHKAHPSVAPLSGGVELSLIGHGFDAETKVRIEGRDVPVIRVESNGRLVIEAPPFWRTGNVEITVNRGDDEARLDDGLRYVKAFHEDIDLTRVVEDDQGIELVSPCDQFGWSPALVDLDGDGMSDVVASFDLGVFVLWGGTNRSITDFPRVIEPIEGVSLLTESDRDMRIYSIGDVNGDDIEDVAFVAGRGVHVFLGGERLPQVSRLREYEGDRLSWIPLDSPPITVIPRVSGHGDHDGDGIGDVLISWADRAFESLSSFRFVQGRRDWPQVVADIVEIQSLEPDDRMATGLAFAGDMDGDGKDEIVVGAPGRFGSDGQVLIIEGGALSEEVAPIDTIQNLRAEGFVKTIQGPSSSGFGIDLANLGDVNGDGLGDFAVGSGAGGIELSGESTIIFGGPSLLGRFVGQDAILMTDLHDLSIRCRGAFAYDRAYGIERAGDVNGDGLADLLIGHWNSRSDAGGLRLVFGGESRVVELFDMRGDGMTIFAPRNRFFGLSDFAGGGDFNGDGVMDIVSRDLTQTDLGEPSPTGFRLTVIYGQASESPFIRGDSNQDGRVDLSDAISTLDFLFLGQDAPVCADAVDADDSGAFDISDAIFTLSHLFLGGEILPPPYPEPGIDPTADTLVCPRGA